MDPSQTIHERNIVQTVDVPVPQGTEQTTSTTWSRPPINPFREISK